MEDLHVQETNKRGSSGGVSVAEMGAMVRVQVEVCVWESC